MLTTPRGKRLLSTDPSPVHHVPRDTVLSSSSNPTIVDAPGPNAAMSVNHRAGTDVGEGTDGAATAWTLVRRLPGLLRKGLCELHMQPAVQVSRLLVAQLQMHQVVRLAAHCVVVVLL